MAFNKNQHFVPKVHLRPFSLDGENLAISLINLRQMKPIPNAPVKNQCSSDYFYGRDPKLESAINFVENNYGEVVRLLEDGHPTVDGRVNIVLKRFAYLQYLRTESASRAASEMVLALQDVSGSDILMPPMREAMLTAVQAAMLHFNETMKIVDDLKLCLVRNHTDMPFVTSDNPAILTNRLHLQRRHKALNSFGVKSAGAIFVLPLNSKLCAILYDGAVYSYGGRERWIDAAKPVDIAALNALQVLGCASNVYFRDWDRREDHLAAAKLVADRRPSSRHTVTHLVLEETNDWGEYYSVKPITDIRNGEKAMVHVKTNHPCPASWPSFLRFRSNASAYSNNTGAGLTREWCLTTGFVRGDGYRKVSV